MAVSCRKEAIRTLVLFGSRSTFIFKEKHRKSYQIDVRYQTNSRSVRYRTQSFTSSSFPNIPS